MINITVIIPTYNRAGMLKEALDSIRLQDIDKEEIEIIVIDDNSTEDYNWIRELFPEVYYYKNTENRGPIYARKFGFQLAKGKYISFFDDDDFLIDSSFFSKAINIMEKKNNITFVSGNAFEYEHLTKKKKENNILDFIGEVDYKKYFSFFQFKYEKPLFDVYNSF